MATAHGGRTDFDRLNAKMKLFDVIRIDLNDDPQFHHTQDPISDWIDFAVQHMTRKRNQEAIDAAQKALKLIEETKDARPEPKAAAGLVVALSRLSMTYSEVEPLLDEAVELNPYGLGSIARRVKRWGSDLE